MGWNVPDDWGMYYSNCGYCGGRYHASEGGCGCLEDAEQCHACKSERRTRWTHDSLAEIEGWHPIDDLEEIAGKYFCESHQECGCCENRPDHDDEVKLEWCEDADMLVCQRCVEEDHYCEKDGPLLDHLAKVTE